jgi:hypothetical protein
MASQLVMCIKGGSSTERFSRRSIIRVPKALLTSYRLRNWSLIQGSGVQPGIIIRRHCGFLSHPKDVAQLLRQFPTPKDTH